VKNGDGAPITESTESRRRACASSPDPTPVISAPSPFFPARRNVKLVIAYNGAAYHGWQRQSPDIDTVQQRIEETAARILGHPVSVSGAGRTDAGVHAAGQAANLHTTNLAIPLEALRRAMNSRLPGDIAIRSATVVDDDFHASWSAVGKTYRYHIWTSPVRPVNLVNLVYHFWRPLDADAMAAAGERLLGTHDFRGFASGEDQRENSVRTVRRCEVADVGSEIQVSVQGDGFLYKMVRNIAGTLIEIGRGRWGPDRIDRILASMDRRDAGPTAPPTGLCLMCVHYDDQA